MLIVGDTRVRELEKFAQDMPCAGWRLEFLFAPGAKMDQCVGLLEEWKKNQYPDRPKLIIMISMIHDAITQYRLPDGKYFLKIAEGVEKRGPYPSLTGLEKKIGDLERKLKGWWCDMELIWIDPYPIDVRRWCEKKFKGVGSLSQEEIWKCHQVTYDFAVYTDRANCIGTRIKNMGDRFIPWYSLWNDCHRSDVNYNNFLREFEAGRKFGWINSTRTVDGFLPSRALCRQSLKMFFRRAWYVVPPPRNIMSSVGRLGLASKVVRDAPHSSDTPVDVVTDLSVEEVQVEEVSYDLEDQVIVEVCKEDTDLGVLMKRIHEVSFLKDCSSSSTGHGLKMTSETDDGARSSDFPTQFVSTVVHNFVKTTYPCGHSFPFGKVEKLDNFSPISLCPVCGTDWNDRKVVKSSFHFFDFK